MDERTVILYHGSNVVVEHPKILTHGFYKDFGYGFYCTQLEKQARRWALTKKQHHIVNKYSMLSAEGLKILRFPEMSEEWLDFVVACRRGLKHSYDIAEGPMADDTIWDYIEDFADGSISRTAFWELAKFKYPTHQIAFCSEKSLKLLHFEGSIAL